MCTTAVPQTSFYKRSSNIMDLSCLISDQTPLTPRTTSSFSPRNESSSSSSYFALSVPTSPFRSAQPPPSPPVEDYRTCSLPSISSLLESAGDASLHAAKRQRQNPPSQQQKVVVEEQEVVRGQSQSLKNHDAVVVNGRPVHLPLTPPLVPDSQFRRQSHSPSVSSTSHPSTSDFMSRSPDLYSFQQQQQQQRQQQQQQQPPQKQQPPPQQQPLPSMSPVQHPSGPSPPYGSPTLGATSYASPTESSAPTASMYYYPQTQSPVHPHPLQVTNGSQGISGNPMTPATWQHHHHYFPPSNTAPYQQSQDRYVCRVCNKAFSRPSSLRIHSHSHTGEKPFRCTHAGCGKSFSVRSNMKRHERGCHPRRPTAALV